MLKDNRLYLRVDLSKENSPNCLKDFVNIPSNIRDHFCNILNMHERKRWFSYMKSWKSFQTCALPVLKSGVPNVVRNFWRSSWVAHPSPCLELKATTEFGRREKDREREREQLVQSSLFLFLTTFGDLTK